MNNSDSSLYDFIINEIEWKNTGVLSTSYTVQVLQPLFVLYRCVCLFHLLEENTGLGKDGPWSVELLLHPNPGENNWAITKEILGNAWKLWKHKMKHSYLPEVVINES